MPLLGGFKRGEVGTVIADAAYDADHIRERARSLRARCCIKPNPTRKRKRRHGKERYKRRNVVERAIGQMKQFRRVATRYEKKPENYLGFVWLAAAFVNL